MFLEGEILSQLHRKPQVPHLISTPTLNASQASKVVLVSSDLDPENKCAPVLNVSFLEMIPAKEASDHSYASPTPHKKASRSPVINNETHGLNEHNYVEISDIPIEPYKSHESDSQDEIVTTGGKFILSKSDQVEISLEYQCDVTLPEATDDQTALKEAMDKNKPHDGTPSIDHLSMLHDKTNNAELPDKTTELKGSTPRIIPDKTLAVGLDETPKNLNSSKTYNQTPNETGNVSDTESPSTQAQPSSPTVQPYKDTTENIDVQSAPDQKSLTEANDSEQTVLIDSSGTPSTVEENFKWEELKTCIIRLTELSKAEWDKWLMNDETTPKNSPRYDMHNRNSIPNRRQSSRNRKNINYSDHNTRENNQDSDYEPNLPPPVPLNNRSKSAKTRR